MQLPRHFAAMLLLSSTALLGRLTAQTATPSRAYWSHVNRTADSAAQIACASKEALDSVTVQSARSRQGNSTATAAALQFLLSRAVPALATKLMEQKSAFEEIPAPRAGTSQADRLLTTLDDMYSTMRSLGRAATEAQTEAEALRLADLAQATIHDLNDALLAYRSARRALGRALTVTNAGVFECRYRSIQ